MNEELLYLFKGLRSFLRPERRTRPASMQMTPRRLSFLQSLNAQASY